MKEDDTNPNEDEIYKVGGIETGDLGHLREVMEARGLRAPSTGSDHVAHADQKDRERRDAMVLDAVLDQLTEQQTQRFMRFSGVTINITAAAIAADRYFADASYRASFVSAFAKRSPDGLFTEHDVDAFFRAAQALRENPDNQTARETMEELANLSPKAFEALDLQARAAANAPGFAASEIASTLSGAEALQSQDFTQEQTHGSSDGPLLGF